MRLLLLTRLRISLTAIAALRTGTVSLFAGPGFAGVDAAAEHFDAVHAFDGFLGFFVIGHFHESESAGAAGHAILDDARRRHGTESAEGFLQGFIGGGVGNIAHVNIHALSLFEIPAVSGIYIGGFLVKRKTKDDLRTNTPKAGDLNINSVTKLQSVILLRFPTIMTQYYLGIDCSTQSITAIVLAQEEEKNPASTRILLEKSLNFDASYPEFCTRNGVLPGEPGLAHTPPQLWVRALEDLLQVVKNEGIPLHQIAGIGVSGQQHGSVYLNAGAEKTMASLNVKLGLAEQLEGIYSRKTSPIWMDATTTEECREIAAALGGDDAVCKLTGSRCFERFTGPQIRRFYKTEPTNYSQTAHICLVSSFIPSLLAGKIIPIDPGDGAGMNLMDIATRAWSPEALRVTAPGLDQKLLPVLESGAIAGTVSPYFTARFGFSPDCKILPGTGDNPASLVGLGLVSSGAIGISLGTSDTVFAFMSDVHTDPDGASHVFGSPTGAYMAISVYKNGSLAREAVRNSHGLSWEAFSEILKTTSPGNGGKIMLPYFDNEIIPRINKAGVQRYGFTVEDVEGDVRAVVEAQMASMFLHSAWMGEKPRRIHATGGASNNREILQVMSDMFGVPVIRQETSNSAALGAAIRIQHAILTIVRPEVSFELLAQPHVRTTMALTPDVSAHQVYQGFLSTYRMQETEYVKSLK